MKIDLIELFKDFPNIPLDDLPKNYNRFIIDSREIKQNDIFVALKGNTTDGHNYVREAISSGAILAIVEKDLNLKGPILKVDSTANFLKYLGNFARNKINAAIFGITGSAGKTTTKEGLSLALSKRFIVAKTEGNINTEISLPLFFANEISGTEDFIVVEMGIQKPNDMDVLIDIVKPNYGIITNIGDSHLEYLGDRKGVLKEKFKLADFVCERNGICFLNGDDELLRIASSNLQGIIKVGFDESNDFILSILEETPESMRLRIKVQERVFEFTVPYNGFTYNVGLIFASSYYVGVDPDLIVSSLKEFKPYKGRGEKLVFGSVTIIDDTYNSNPVSLNLALRRLRGVDDPIVLILGDMLELGARSEYLHREAGKQVAEVNPYMLITYGTFSRLIHEEAKAVHKYHFDDKEELSKFLETFNFPEKTVFLVKGSRGMKMEQFVNVLKERYKNEE